MAFVYSHQNREIAWGWGFILFHTENCLFNLPLIREIWLWEYHSLNVRPDEYHQLCSTMLNLFSRGEPNKFSGNRGAKSANDRFCWQDNGTYLAHFGTNMYAHPFIQHVYNSNVWQQDSCNSPCEQLPPNTSVPTTITYFLILSLSVYKISLD
jgi:hypothetical protein